MYIQIALMIPWWLQSLTMGENYSGRFKRKHGFPSCSIEEVPFDKVFEALLNRAIDMRIISAESRAAGFDKDPKVLKKIADAKDALLQKIFP